MAKPFSLQAPEEIAKEYGGNKAKIAEATQMGIVDPTAAVLAGMFIDRMRNAAQMEAAPQQTIAQQVLAPQQPMAPGAGAMPPAAPPAPPMGAMPAPQMPMEAAPGMAEGGLAGLYVPETMFDEPDMGGYAGGGLVAFADGGAVDEYGRPLTLQGAQSFYDMLMPQYNDQYEKEAEKEALALRSEEGRKKARKEDMWAALGQLGARIATTPGGLLYGASSAIQETLPEVVSQKAARKLEQKQALDSLVGIEGQRYNRKGDRVRSALEIQGQAISSDQARKTREQALTIAREGDVTQLEAARIAAGARGGGNGLFSNSDLGGQLAKFVAAQTKFDQAKAVSANRPSNNDYKKARIEAHGEYFAQTNVLRAMQGQPPLSLAEFNRQIGYAQSASGNPPAAASKPRTSRVPDDFQIVPVRGG